MRRMLQTSKWMFWQQESFNYEMSKTKGPEGQAPLLMDYLVCVTLCVSLNPSQLPVKKVSLFQRWKKWKATIFLIADILKT